MDSLVNSYDALEQLIYDENIRIKAVDIHPDMDMMLIILNIGSVLQEKLSSYPRLQNASIENLNNYTLIGKGVGVHWEELYEDLSLKSFLKDVVKKQVLGAAK